MKSKRLKILRLFEEVALKNHTRKEFYLVVKYLLENEIKVARKNKDAPCNYVLSELLDKLDAYYYEN